MIVTSNGRALSLDARHLAQSLAPQPNTDYESTRQLIAGFCSDVLSQFQGSDRAMVLRAAEIATALHSAQGRRRDGSSYIDHIYRVVRNVTSMVERPSAEIVCAALLHDTIEDCPAQLIRALGGSPKCDCGKELQAQAHDALRAAFGSRIDLMVTRLTNDDFKQAAKEALAYLPQETEKDKATYASRFRRLVNRGYQAHIVDLWKDQSELGQATLVVKLADFFDNSCDHAALPAATPQQRADKERLELKRGPLLLGLEYSIGDLPASHLLAPRREQIREMFSNVYRQQYLV